MLNNLLGLNWLGSNPLLTIVCGLVVVGFIGLILYGIRPQKPVVFHICRAMPSGTSEPLYAYWRNGRPSLSSGPLAQIVSELRKATDALMVAEEYPPPFLIYFTHPSCREHIKREARWSKAILYEPLSETERREFWGKYNAAPVALAA